MNWIEAKSKQNGEVSNTELLCKAWRNYWRIRLPERVKILCWRIFYNALPIATNLMRRECSTNQDCCFCSYKEESVSRIFLECWWAKEFWRRMGLSLPAGSSFSNAADCLWYFMTEGNMVDLKRIMVGCWITWFNWNLQAYGKTGMNLERCS
ncbi:hypothetical protein QQ045_006430 [Rhodiola kirilowii]